MPVPWIAENGIGSPSPSSYISTVFWVPRFPSALFAPSTIGFFERRSSSATS